MALSSGAGSVGEEAGRATGDPAVPGPTAAVSGLDESASGSGSHRHRWHRRLLAAAAVAVLAGGAFWWFSPHPAMDLSGTDNTLVCATRTTAGERDVVLGNVAFAPPRGVDLLSVQLVDPVNITLVDAKIAPTVPQRGGGGTIPGLALGWPLTAEDRASFTLDFAAERDLVGAHLTGEVAEAPILHLQVGDPSRDASFRSWRVVYRMDGRRWVSTFTHAFRMPGGVTSAPCTL